MDRLLNMVIRMVMRQVTQRAVNKGVDMMADRGGPKLEKGRAADAVRLVRRASRF